uniref:4-amino-5-hydroxymethyl-2-methylpyrimidine phosphate synthase n=1 Tax=Pseudozyma flocculosa TaxID=84751 RepID=D2X5X9_9BASI|nr:putative thiamine biosynthesis protein [Pseudozyma flocculosa]
MPNPSISSYAPSISSYAPSSSPSTALQTEIIGSGKADMGCKAMIHTIAAKARGWDVQSIGTLMDEPFTGVVYLEGSGITDFRSLKGKKIGYVGEFGKIQVSPRPPVHRRAARISSLRRAIDDADE